MLFFAHTHLTVTVTVGLLLIPKVFESPVSFLLPRLRKINVVMQKQFCLNLASKQLIEKEDVKFGYFT